MDKIIIDYIVKNANLISMSSINFSIFKNIFILMKHFIL